MKASQLFLNGVLVHANLRREELRGGEKKAARINAITGVLFTDDGTVHICNNSLQCLLCVGSKN